MTTETLPQPFLRINAPTTCADQGRHAPQVTPVLGNADRAVPAYVVQHGRHYLAADGRVTTTPVWLTWAEAKAAEQAHADAVAH